MSGKPWRRSSFYDKTRRRTRDSRKCKKCLIDLEQIRPVHTINIPQNGHEYLIMSKFVNELPGIMRATPEQLAKCQNNAPALVVPSLELPRVKNIKILPTKSDIMIYIEQYENARINIEKTRESIDSSEIEVPIEISFTFLFGKRLNSTSPLNPRHNVEKSFRLCQRQYHEIISMFVHGIRNEKITTRDVTYWTFSVYASMDSHPSPTLISNMRILTIQFIKARAAIVDHMDMAALQYNCLINLVSEKFGQYDLGDIMNYKNHYSGCSKMKIVR